MLKRKLTPPEMAALWGINPDKVINWIKSGELPAIDASTKRGGRPRYRIDVDDIADFEKRRTVAAAVTQKPKAQQSDDVTEYF